MLAILYLLLCFLTGWALKRLFRIDAAALFRRIAGEPERDADASVAAAAGSGANATAAMGTGADGAAGDAIPGGRTGRALPPAWTFDIPFALIAGTTFVTTVHYFIAYTADALNDLLRTSLHPLTASNLVVAGVFAVFCFVCIFRKRRTVVRERQGGMPSDPSGVSLYGHPGGVAPDRGALPHMYASRVTRYFADSPAFYGGTLWFFGLFAIFLIFYSFFVKGSILHSGFTVFSDFAPHTAVISSFAYGNNFPTEYPHFAGDGIQYHFFFFYLCANLLHLGLRFDVAMNLPSILGILSFTTLLGSLGVVLTRRRGVFLLAPFLLFFRSSYAVFDYLRELFRENGATLLSVVRKVFATDTFIGTTLHDDWGLWAMNVYANQRHFLWGMSIFLIVLFLLLPTLRRPTVPGKGPAKLQQGGRPSLGDAWAKAADYFRSPARWAIRSARPMVPAILLTVCLSYWHGSVLIAMLSVLFVMALFAYERFAYLLVAVAGVGSSMLLSAFFSGGAGNVVQPSFVWGFLADDKSLPGVATYLFKVLGVALLFMVVMPFAAPRRENRIFAAAAMVPVLFALTVSLTPDVTVNHKYIIIAVALMNIFVADLYCSLWDVVRSGIRRRPGIAVPTAVLAIFLGFALTATGFVELIGYTNKNRNSVPIDLKSPLTAWLRANTGPEDVFLTAPYHMNAFFFSGRKVFYGWPYYTMTAGHDTEARILLVYEMYNGSGGDRSALVALAKEYGIRYAIFDRELRVNSGYHIDEAFFAENFEKVAEFPGLSDTVIYKLYDG